MFFQLRDQRLTALKRQRVFYFQTILADQYAKEYKLDPTQKSFLYNLAEILKDNGKSISLIALLDGK